MVGAFTNSDIVLANTETIGRLGREEIGAGLNAYRRLGQVSLETARQLSRSAAAFGVDLFRRTTIRDSGQGIVPVAA